MSYYFTNDESLKSEEKLFKTTINELPFSFWSDNGVFSKSKLDYGTRLLLETIPNLNGDVLDLGCGYGPIGIYIAKKHSINVDMIDVNNRALLLSQKNSKVNNVETTVFESEGYSNISKKYDYIITNPPIRVGKEMLYDLLFNGINYLKNNGELWLVIHKDQGAKSLANDLKKSFTVEIINKSKGFYIIKAKNN